jgi:hypothetical protein
LPPDKAVNQTLSHEELHDFDLTPIGCWCSTDLLAGETNSKNENWRSKTSWIKHVTGTGIYFSNNPFQQE